MSALTNAAGGRSLGQPPNEMKAGARGAPAKINLLLKEKPVPFVTRLGEHATRTRVIHRESDAVQQDCKVCRCGGATECPGEIGWIKGVGRSWAVMPNLPVWLPGDVDGCVGILRPWPQECNVVDHARFRQVKVHGLAARRKGFILHLHDPEQTRLRNVPIEIVDLCSRTGIEEVNSYEHEGAAMVCAVGRDIFPAVETHVRAEVVLVLVAVGRSSR